jgi:hypothetical protein
LLWSPARADSDYEEKQNGKEQEAGEGQESGKEADPVHQLEE